VTPGTDRLSLHRKRLAGWSLEGSKPRERQGNSQLYVQQAETQKMQRGAACYLISSPFPLMLLMPLCSSHWLHSSSCPPNILTLPLSPLGSSWVSQKKTSPEIEWHSQDKSKKKVDLSCGSLISGEVFFVKLMKEPEWWGGECEEWLGGAMRGVQSMWGA